MGRYALQGSWGPVGQAVFYRAPRDHGGGDYGGARCDSAFPIRGFKRNKETNIWELIKELSPLDLIKDNAKLNPIYMPGCGLIHKEGSGGWSYGHGPQNGKNNNPQNTWWPGTRNMKSWIVAAGWCENEWMSKQYEKLYTNDATDFQQFPYGHADAGLTLNAIDPVTLEIQSQLTIKTDPLYIEDVYENPADYAFFTQHEIDVAPSRLAATTFDVREIYAADRIYGYYPGYPNLNFFYYVMNALDIPTGRKPLMRYAGIPNFANNEPRYANNNYASSTVDVGPEDSFQDQEMSMDEAGENLYFCLTMPFFHRDNDDVVSRTTETVTGVYNTGPFSYTPSVAAFNYNPTLGRYYYFLGANIGHYMTGWEGGPIIGGLNGAGYMTATYGTGPRQAYPWAGFFSQFQDLINHIGWYMPIEQDEANPYILQDINNTDYIAGYPGVQNDVSNVTVPWYQDIPHRVNCTPAVYHGKNDPGITITANTLGSGASVPPFSGVLIFTYTGWARRRYQTGARTFLFKVECKDGILTEKWRKDISLKGKIGSNYGTGNASWGAQYPQAKTDNSVWGRVHLTRVCGRVIFVLREKSVDIRSGLFMEVYDNTQETGLPTLIHEELLPPSLAPSLGIYQPRPNIHMTQGITPEGKEWARINGTTVTSGGIFNEERYSTFLLEIQPVLTDPVKVSSYVGQPDVDETVEPRKNNYRGMAQSEDTYVWVTDRMDVWKRDV